MPVEKFVELSRHSHTACHHSAARKKNDPKYVAAARELRDRFLEQVNTGRLLPGETGKYDASRQLAAAPTELKQTPMLEAA